MRPVTPGPQVLPEPARTRSPAKHQPQAVIMLSFCWSPGPGQCELSPGARSNAAAVLAKVTPRPSLSGSPWPISSWRPALRLVDDVTTLSGWPGLQTQRGGSGISSNDGPGHHDALPTRGPSRHGGNLKRDHVTTRSTSPSPRPGGPTPTRRDAPRIIRVTGSDSSPQQQRLRVPTGICSNHVVRAAGFQVQVQVFQLSSS